jgi:hypothetical protein
MQQKRFFHRLSLTDLAYARLQSRQQLKTGERTKINKIYKNWNFAKN